MSPRALDLTVATLLFGLVFLVLFESLTDPRRLIIGHDMDQPFNWEMFNRHALASGQLPLWNPYVFSGYPALADIQTALFYPPYVLLRLLPLEINSFFSWSLALHLWLIAAGTYLLCREVGTSRPAALCAGIGMMLGGIVAPRVFAGQLLLIHGFAWLPLALSLAIRSFGGGRFAPHPALVLVLVVQFLAGAAQPVLYTLAAIGAYAAFSIIWPASPPPSRRWRLAPLAQFALIGVLFAGLSAFQSFPMFQLMLESGRAGGLPYDRATKGSLHPFGLLTIFYPTAFADYLTQFQDGMGGGLWEKSPYVGLLLAVTAPVALWSRPYRRIASFFSALGIVTLLLSMGEHLPFYHLHHLVLRGFRGPGRLLAVWAISVGVLGAIGLDLLAHRANCRRALRWLLLLYLLAILGSAAVLVSEGLPELASRSLSEWRITRAVGPALVLTIGLVVALALRWLLRGSIKTAWVAAGLVALDLAVFAGQFFTISGPSRNDEAARALARPDVDRILSICQSELTPSSMMNLMVPTPDGYNSSYLRGYADYSSLVRGETIQQPGPTFPKMGEPRALTQLPMLNFLGVTHIHACTNLDARFERVYEAERWSIYRNPGALPRALLVCEVIPVGSNAHGANVLMEQRLDLSRAAVVLQRASAPPMSSINTACAEQSTVHVRERDRPDGRLVVDVTTQTDGFLVISDAYYSERQAWVDGQPATLYRTDLAFSGLPIAAGTHRVELLYVPRSLYVGLIVSALTLLIWVASYAIAIQRRRVPGPAVA